MCAMLGIRAELARSYGGQQELRPAATTQDQGQRSCRALHRRRDWREGRLASRHLPGRCTSSQPGPPRAPRVVAINRPRPGDLRRRHTRELTSESPTCGATWNVTPDHGTALITYERSYRRSWTVCRYQKRSTDGI